MAICKPTAILASVGLLLVGCTIQPLPEDVAALDTYGIVQHIRCETRKVIIDKAAALFLERNSPPALQLLGQAIKDGERSITSVEIKALPSPYRDYITTYLETAISYKFTFTMSFEDLNTAEASFSDPISRGVFGIKVGGSNRNKRQNVSSFTVSDTFRSLTLGLPDKFCDGRVVPPNQLYPITGQIGMKKIIDTFIDLNQTNDIHDPTAKMPTKTTSNILTFTTTISGNTSPTLTLSAANNNFHLASATASATLTRSDEHQVSIALALSDGNEEKTKSKAEAANRDNEAQLLGDRLLKALPR